MGFEHDLITAFAASLGVDVEFKMLPSVAAILEAIGRGEGHITAAGLTRTPQREKTFLFGPDYHTVQQQVVCHRDGPRPRRLPDLPNVELLVIEKSSYVERLGELQDTLPGLRWEATADLVTEEILARVWRKELDCTVADSTIVAINRRYHPELVVVFPITDPQPLAWILRPGSTDLRNALGRWFKKDAQDELLRTLRDRYFGHVDIFDYVDVRTYHKHIEKRLPQFRPLFEYAAKTHDLPWTLLAAVAYQESHWRPRAKSPTGVRGIMMLTQPTAQALGVTNRLDPVQSINGGAKYLARQFRRVPAEVQNPDRLWFGLAAYNVGINHLRDAMVLAERLDKNPHVWRDVKTVLPLLAKRKYFKTVKYGYARGTEPVRFVRRIRNYQEILEKQL
jgi:membrane-bound lytic murein transglycosylase F